MPIRKTKGRASEPEYKLLLTPALDERTQTTVTMLVLETSKSFATYRYELSVKEHFEGKALTISILGFHTPQLSLPASGPARFERQYPHLRGTYAITIKGIDGRTNTFSVRIGQKRIEVIKSPRQPFVEFITETSRWSESHPL